MTGLHRHKNQDAGLLRDTGKICTLLFYVLYVSSCVSAKFSTGGSGPVDSGEQALIYQINCQMEAEELRPEIILPKDASRYAYRLSPSCSVQIEEDRKHAQEKQINIVIVLDRSGSMGPVIRTVKENIIQLASVLEQNGWDAQFAAVGFRDYVNDFIITSFSSARILRQQLETWSAQGGGEPQEAGLSAIRTAADLLEASLRRDPQREAAVNAILYLSDSVAYDHGEPSDFSVDDLSLQAREWKEILPDFRMYYSVPEGLPEENEMGAPAPDVQMAELLRKADLKGRAFAFPPTAAILDAFAREWTNTRSSSLLVCLADTAVMETAIPTAIPEHHSRDNIIDLLTNGEALVFRTSPDPSARDYNLTIRRCCRDMSEESEACQAIRSKTFRLHFGSK
ncbi:MAG: VWA domain-containing protein [Deltaproteobacteria bacterium]|nr:VWA domain-containing protein [Deltaproteobacteria bacterium]